MATESCRLPHELYRNVAEAFACVHGVDSTAERRIDSSLLTLACTSRVFQAEAERIIYSDLNFDNRTVNAPDINHVLHARASRYVVNLTIYGDIFINLPFERMEHLRSLTILPLKYRPSVNLFNSLHENLPVDVLQKFTVTPGAYSAALNVHHLAFLEGQSGLREICIMSLPPELPLVTSFLPNVDTADLGLASPTEVCRFLSSRPIRSLSFKISRPNFSNIAFHGASLRVLDVTFASQLSHGLWLGFLQLRKKDCPGLRLLCIEGSVSSIPAEGEIESVHSLLNVLNGWRYLEACSIAIPRASWLNRWLILLSQPSLLPHVHSVILWGGRKVLERGYELRRDNGGRWSSYENVTLSEWRKIWVSKALGSSSSSSSELRKFETGGEISRAS
ncbi:hypothetical protein SISNIDRAFT_553127 [Sistotremastrum niveocremeum HHB9708]|uniref:F-box domain-containing protein n=1 Tax=Sistotremastrum niveocremeum HHB9708 TaxID=1314777 RepID=A0A164NAG7_9AGAM|nr:hypothetical protein SISNIDRAFT_553127 [Sistotremastrum niveocremeum HHB9708]